jgi:hypothetical protein
MIYRYRGGPVVVVVVVVVAAAAAAVAVFVGPESQQLVVIDTPGHPEIRVARAGSFGFNRSRGIDAAIASSNLLRAARPRGARAIDYKSGPLKRPPTLLFLDAARSRQTSCTLH